MTDLRKRFDALVAKNARELRAAMVENHQAYANEHRSHEIAILPTWRQQERQLEVLFVVRDLHEGSVRRGTLEHRDPFLFAHPARIPDRAASHGAAMAVRFTIDRTGKRIGEHVYLPQSFTSGDEWYG